METTEVVSQLDPKSRKVWYGMAGNRFWSVRFSRMLVARFDSDHPQVGPRLRVSVGAPSGPCKPCACATATLGVHCRPALGMVAERSRRGQMAQDDATGSRCGFSALEAESCLPQIPHSYLNMQPNQPKQKKYYAENTVSPHWLLSEGHTQWYFRDSIRVRILITNSENLRAEIARG